MGTFGFWNCYPSHIHRSRKIGRCFHKSFESFLFLPEGLSLRQISASQGAYREELPVYIYAYPEKLHARFRQRERKGFINGEARHLHKGRRPLSRLSLSSAVFTRFSYRDALYNIQPESCTICGNIL